MVEIRKVEWGIANSYPKEDLIEIHSDLDKPEYEGLKRKILAHEMEHIKKKSQGFIAQRRVDFRTNLSFRDLLPFIKNHKKNFLQQYFPITYKDNTIFFEWSLIILYFVYAGIGTLIYFLIKLFSKDSTFFWIIIRNMVVISMVVFLIYFGAKRLFKYINEEYKKEESLSEKKK